MLTYLTKTPDPDGKFKLMEHWRDIKRSNEDDYAKSLYMRKEIVFDFDAICNLRSKDLLIAYLRYDYKKILIRTRYIYIDRLINPADNKLQSSNRDLDFAFFEPTFLCFPFLEFLGRLRFPEDYNPPEKRNTSLILKKMLVRMGDGYSKYSQKLTEWHRHALAHELRPSGSWMYDLNTGEKYAYPYITNKEMIYLNIPHFIDSCIFELEKLCDDLVWPTQKVDIMKNFIEYNKKNKIESAE